MSLLHPSTTTRRLLKIASLGLAGLIAGLLTGCTSSVPSIHISPKNDTDWQTSSTYASATASLPPRNAARTAPHISPRHPSALHHR
jgi:hypothetical protein